MMTPRDEVRQLIRRGLFANNLSKLISLCEQLFHARPAVYGSMIFTCRSLFDEQDSDQGTTVQRIDEINQALQGPMLKAVDAEFDPPAALLQALHQLHTGFRSVS